jgi:hypothetical protein
MIAAFELSSVYNLLTSVIQNFGRQNQNFNGMNFYGGNHKLNFSKFLEVLMIFCIFSSFLAKLFFLSHY